MDPYKIKEYVIIKRDKHQQIKHALKSNNNEKGERQTEKCSFIMTPLNNTIKN